MRESEWGKITKKTDQEKKLKLIIKKKQQQKNIDC